MECSKFLKGFQLKPGDEVIVHPDLATLKQSCDESNSNWDADKENYIVSLNPQDVGTVGKCDYLGQGRRVQFCDGHWWSFAPEVLAVRLTSLTSSQRQFLPDSSEQYVVWHLKSKTAPQGASTAVAVASDVATVAAADVASDVTGGVKKARTRRTAVVLAHPSGTR